MRPDLSYVVGILAKFSNKPTRLACAAVTRVLQYMHNTRDMELILGGESARIIAYFDSDFAACLDTRCSIGAYYIFLGFGCVEWASKRAKVPANSTAEAEYIAANAPARSILWLRWLLKQTGIQAAITRYSSTLFGDNTAAETMIENPINHNTKKHIALKYRYIEKLVECGVIATEHIGTELNIADIGTKALGRVKFYAHRKRVFGGEELDVPTKRRVTEVSDDFC
jgi:hypothetical protein